jgi:hypothetical protein
VQLSSRGDDRLTAQERDVLAMISEGCSNKRTLVMVGIVSAVAALVSVIVFGTAFGSF